MSRKADEYELGKVLSSGSILCSKQSNSDKACLLVPGCDVNHSKCLARVSSSVLLAPLYNGRFALRVLLL